ncbi:Alpha/Beta hydrolase protein [Xylariaceae sp. FL0016]|nr:Alpha/Beta hydrolase protein [Xylariaceae sp. FL0016]
MKFPAFVALAISCCWGIVARAATLPTATISAGTLVGISTSLPSSNVTVNKFLGIPYAAAPVDQLRFAMPQAPKPWSGEFLNASSFQAACFQMGATDPLPVPQSEDCLYINVFAPSTPAPESGRTVLVWIHGGALKTGTAAWSFYDGSSFAGNQDVVFVSLNYRLNAFGLPNAPALPLEESNLAFYDQRLALNWIKDNIASFGGDPAKVTVFGQSSGSTSVSRLVSTMRDNAPFRAAIMQSGVYDYGYESGSPGLVGETDAWDYLVEELGCRQNTSSRAVGDELACMQNVDALAIQDVVDGNSNLVLPGKNDNITQYAYPEYERREGRVAHVPILLGHTLNDASLFTDSSYTTLDKYIAAEPNLAPVQDEIAAAYPVGNGTGSYASQWEANAASRTDDLFGCPISRVAKATTELGLPVWRYLFNATFPDNENPGYGVYHGSELKLVFGTYNASTATAEEKALSKTMQTAWADFAKDPWGAGPGWTRMNPGNRSGDYAVAALGSVDKNPVGASVISSDSIDGNCKIYASSYEAGQGGVAWW